MLTLFNGNKHRDCTGTSRRDFLRVGTLGLGGLSLPWLLQQQAAAATGESFVRDKSVVFLYLNGGPSHIETWEPKMQAPVEFRSMTGEVKTSLPGVTFGGTFPKLAKLAHKVAVVRSFTSGTSNHKAGTVRILSGGSRGSERDTNGYGLGAAYSRLRGTNHPETGIPTFAQFLDESRDKAYTNGTKRFTDGNHPGELGGAYAAFDPGGKGPMKNNMQLKLAADRFSDRRGLLKELDKVRRKIDDTESIGALKRQAFDLILGSARDAFDLKKEDAKTLAKYDTRHMQVGYKDKHPSPLGRHLLLARRLCEAGCGFITINSPAWDMHRGGNNPGIIEGMNTWGPHVDHAVSAFLEDLSDRGMSDKILLVITGEMGRTPRINKKGGRDHWGNLCSLMLAGGGWKMGQVVGRSDKQAGRPATDRIGPENLMATVMHTLFDVGKLRVERGLPSELVKNIDQADPIPQL